MYQFLEQLKREGVFAKEVRTCGLAFHSYFMEATAPSLLQALKKVGWPRLGLPEGGRGRAVDPSTLALPQQPCAQVIPEPRPRSPRWLSTSVPEAEWQSSLACTCSAEYSVNNLLSPVLFQEALQHVPEHAVVLEISPHALLQVRARGQVCWLQEGSRLWEAAPGSALWAGGNW